MFENRKFPRVSKASDFISQQCLLFFNDRWVVDRCIDHPPTLTLMDHYDIYGI